MAEKVNSERTLKASRHSHLVKLQDLKERAPRPGYSVCEAEAGSSGLTWELIRHEESQAPP